MTSSHGNAIPEDPTSTEARNTIDKFRSVVKDLVPQAAGLYAQAKQDALGVVGKGITAVAQFGEPNRLKREAATDRKFQLEDERKSFQSQIFRGGEAYSDSIQTSMNLNKPEDIGAKQQAEIAENTKMAAKELHDGFSMLITTIKDMGKLGAVLK